MSPDTGILEPYMYGIMASMLLSGVTIAQAYDYSQSYRSDRLWMKLLIAFVTFLTILNAICNLITLHSKLINNFGNFPGAFAGDASDMVQHFVGPLMCFFLQRTYSAAKSNIVLFSVGSLVLATLVAGWVEAVAGISPTQHLLTYVQIYSWMSCVCDVIISGIFIFSMKKLQRSPSEYELPAHSIAGKLLVMSFEASLADMVIRRTAALTSLFAILNAIFSKLGGHIGIYGLIFNFCLPNIFCITVLFVLNSRRHLRDAQDQNSSNSRGNANRKVFAAGGSQAGQIEVTLQTFVQTEGPVEGEDSKANGRDWPDDVPGRGSAPRAVTFDEVLPH